MNKVVLTSRAKKELKILSKVYKAVIKAALQEISEDPFIGKPLNRELNRKFSYRVNTYRIIYQIYPKDRKIIIITAGHRGKIYD